jgi:hypothetical protein
VPVFDEDAAREALAEIADESHDDDHSIDDMIRLQNLAPGTASSVRLWKKWWREHPKR